VIVVKSLRSWLPVLILSIVLFSDISFANEAVFKKTLENGLVVLARSSPPKDLVTINITVKAALLHEEEYLGSGISHMVEHMLFKGTKTRKAGDIEKEVRSYGGSIDGSVSSDSTVYQITVPAEYFPNALALLKDMLLNAAFESGEFEKEREVVLKEVKLNEDDPEKKTIISLFANAYTRHPYRYPAIGFESLLKALTRDDLVKYYEKRYVPNNIVISVVGGIDDKDAEIGRAHV
jgi:zinc protease